MHLRFLLTLFAMLFLETTSGDDGDPPDATDDTNEKVTFDAKQQEAINRLLAKERKDAEDRTAQRLKDEATKREQQETDKRERDEAEKRGEFEKVKSDLETKLATAEGERDSLQERLDAALKVIGTTVEASWNDAPEEVRDLYDGEDDPLAKQAFLSKPATVKLIERLTKKPARIPRDPEPGGNAGDDDAGPSLSKSKLF